MIIFSTYVDYMYPMLSKSWVLFSFFIIINLIKIFKQISKIY